MFSLYKQRLFLVWVPLSEASGPVICLPSQASYCFEDPIFFLNQVGQYLDCFSCWQGSHLASRNIIAVPGLNHGFGVTGLVLPGAPVLNENMRTMLRWVPGTVVHAQRFAYGLLLTSTILKNGTRRFGIMFRAPLQCPGQKDCKFPRFKFALPPWLSFDVSERPRHDHLHSAPTEELWWSDSSEPTWLQTS
ncbi:hypothetical protein K438DRAFT_2058890 [Mycena galopus ATCC 62051]|nr:hypothetical protein K438DRAFT_2058890 [Mycena galopus ATCC 62051]